jgi:hypothetical protein
MNYIEPDHSDDLLQRFDAALDKLHVDNEGCAPNNWPDVRACTDVLEEIHLAMLSGQRPDLSSDALFSRLWDLTGHVVATYVVIAEDNPRVVREWRDALKRWRSTRSGEEL